MSAKLVPDNPRRNSVLGITSHDNKKHRRDQIFEDGFDFTLADTRKEMAKQQGGFDKTKVRVGVEKYWTHQVKGGRGKGGHPRGTTVYHHRKRHQRKSFIVEELTRGARARWEHFPENAYRHRTKSVRFASPKRRNVTPPFSHSLFLVMVSSCSFRLSLEPTLHCTGSVPRRK